MLGDFINRGLVMILGYAYPAFECLKTLEKNRVGMDELRFWCQYWIIVALLSVAERLGDMLISWLPLYAELKLVFIIYLWYPKTKGTSYVYESFLLPFVSKHETDIERRLQELRYRAWDLAIYYMQNCTQLGQSAFFEIMHYIANQSSKLKSGVTPEKNDQNQPRGPTRPPPSPPPPPTNFAPPSPRGRPSNDNRVSTPRRHTNNVAPPSPLRGAATSNQNLTQRYTPSAPPLPPTLFRSDAGMPKSKVVVMRPSEEHVEYVHVEEVEKVK
ncbi:HVA22-like protein [Drosera capensis]